VHTLTQVILDGIILGGFYALMAQGLSLVFGIMRIINLAHGEFLVMGAYLAWAAQQYLGLDVLVALPLLIILGFGFGWVISRVLVMPVLERHELMPLLVTFGLASVIAGALTLIFSTTPKVTKAAYSDSVISLLGFRVSVSKAVMLAAALILLTLLTLFLDRTKQGKAMKATAQNRAAARIVGINVTKVYCSAFGLGTAVAFAAGGLFSVTQGFYPFMGGMFTLKAFVIVVLGGAGDLRGAFLASLAVGVADAYGKAFLPTLAEFTMMALVVVVLAWRPQGLFGGAH
jgi:branched-chain amino acid transport system permease protein